MMCIARKTPLLLLSTLVLLSSLTWAAQTHFKRSAMPGTSVIAAGGMQFEVSTSHPIIINFVIDGESVTGMVEPASSSNNETPYVTIVLLGEPDRTLYEGKVTGPTPFESVRPHETGQTDY